MAELSSEEGRTVHGLALDSKATLLLTDRGVKGTPGGPSDEVRVYREESPGGVTKDSSDEMAFLERPDSLANAENNMGSFVLKLPFWRVIGCGYILRQIFLNNLSCIKPQ